MNRRAATIDTDGGFFLAFAGSVCRGWSTRCVVANNGQFNFEPAIRNTKVVDDVAVGVEVACVAGDDWMTACVC